MMNIRTYIANKIFDLVRLGRVIKVDDSLPLQKVDVNVRVGMIDTSVARIQNYGFSSVPDAAGALLGVEITCNGNRFVIALDDLDSRPSGNAAGEVMMWHKNGDFIHMQNGNAITVQTHDYIVNATTMYLNGDLVHNGDSTSTGNAGRTGDTTQTGNSEITGNTTQTGTITASVDVIAAGKSGATHTHNHQHEHDYGVVVPVATLEPNT